MSTEIVGSHRYESRWIFDRGMAEVCWTGRDERKGEKKGPVLLRQIFIQRHGFDLRTDAMPGFYPEVYERFSGNAGNKRRSDIQQHVH